MGLLELERVSKTYSTGTQQVFALASVSLRVEPGEFVVVTGPSGSGKSTLLHVAAGLEEPDEGSVDFDGTDLYSMSEKRRLQLRRNDLGFVHQFFNLLAPLTAVENVALPLVLAGVHPDDAQGEARGLLADLGLGDRLDHKPAELSGGQQQRVAIARALVHRPRLVLADEPTGNLDSRAGADVLDVMHALCAELGVAILLVTHDASAIAHASRHVALTDGHLLAEVAS